MTVPGDPVAAPETGAGARADGMSPRAWWTAVIYIAAVAMFLRFYDLPLKPLHHDEGVNTLFLTNLVRPPHAYAYNPGNYHGPTLFYFGWLSAAVFGLTTVAIRLVTAVAGLAVVLLVLLLRRQLGAAGSLAAAALLAVSPGAVYYSRYFIHESLLVCFTVATVVFAVHWWTHRRPAFLHLAAASAAMMFATKETAIISAIVLTVAAGAACVILDARTAIGRGASGPFLHVLSSAIVTRARAVPGEVAQRGGLFAVALALGVFVTVNLLFYTSLFTHWQGAVDALRTFAVWTRTGTTAHTRPWHTYIRWLTAEELSLAMLGLAGVVTALWRAENRLSVFAGLWTLGVIAAYSIIPYKTPWLTLNMIAPLAISAGHACETAWPHRRRLPGPAFGIAALAAVGLGAFQSIVLSFSQYDNVRYPYVYAHTSREALGLVREIDRIQTLNPGASIAVTSRDHFPLSWYLRAYRAGYYGRPVVTGDPIIVASDSQQAVLDASLGQPFELVGSYRLRPGVQLVLYVRRDLRRPPPDASGAGPRPTPSR
jgi:uncharacterized protein (TIGR03663 family)